MARDLGPKCRICRREGMKLFLKGERCLTEKCAIERRSYPPGEHGRGRIKQSEYLLQLREKQKARRYYGLLEKQFRTYYEKAAKGPASRARTCFAARAAARQRRLPPRLCGIARTSAPARAARPLPGQRPPGEHPELPGSAGRHHHRGGELVRAASYSRRDRLVSTVAPWLQADHDGLTGKVLKQPERAEIDTPVRSSSSSSSTRSNGRKGIYLATVRWTSRSRRSSTRTSTITAGSSPSSRSTAASATRSATRCAACCSRRSRARRSPRSRSRASRTSSRRCRASVRTSPTSSST